MNEALADILLRPFRFTYCEETDLGPKYFILNDNIFERQDFKWKNKFDLHISASLYIPKIRLNKVYPCVIYCHGNCGNRLSGFECLETLISINIGILVFDFTGAGVSEGQIVTYGFREKFDIECVVDNLRKLPFISEIGIWGRSMGAVSTLLYASMDSSKIVGICLDSPFTDLSQIISEVMFKYNVPTEFLRDLIVNQLKYAVKQKADFSLENAIVQFFFDHLKMQYIIVMQKLQMKLSNAKFLHYLFMVLQTNLYLFSTVKNQVKLIINYIQNIHFCYQRYGHNCKFITVEQDHNDKRPKWALTEIRHFFSDLFHLAKKKRQVAQKSSNVTKILQSRGDSSSIFDSGVKQLSEAISDDLCIDEFQIQNKVQQSIEKPSRNRFKQEEKNSSSRAKSNLMIKKDKDKINISPMQDLNKRSVSPLGKAVYYIDENNFENEITTMKKRSQKKMQFFNIQTPSPQNTIFQSQNIEHILSSNKQEMNYMLDSAQFDLNKINEQNTISPISDFTDSFYQQLGIDNKKHKKNIQKKHFFTES